MPAGQAKQFSVFLSHAYGAPDVNLFFFKLLFRTGAVQFEVDKGEFTSVTRIERAMRRAEAFLGFHSLPAGVEPTSDVLSKSSRYFRFELDVAVRARKPGLLFVDERYGDLIPDVSGMEVHRYDFRELSEDSNSPRSDLYASAFKRLSSTVMAHRKVKLDNPSAGEVERWHSDRVGLLLPPSGGYSKSLLDKIRAKLVAAHFSLFEPKYPLSLDLQLQSELRRLDFAIVDIGDPASAAIASYLHGSYVPLLRIMRADGKMSPEANLSLQTLFGAFEVGYRKELLQWTSTAHLLDGINIRLKRIREQQVLIHTAGEAEEYFRGAARRPKKVFLSYSGEDVDFAKSLEEELLRRFEGVFNYKPKEAKHGLTPGAVWEKELYSKIEDSDIGVALYSQSYFSSRHCEKEAAAMADRRDSGEFLLIGVRLQQEVKLPPFLRPYQNIRGWTFDGNISGLVDEIVRSTDLLSASKKKRAAK
jgi:hypothetical protein